MKDLDSILTPLSLSSEANETASAAFNICLQLAAEIREQSLFIHENTQAQAEVTRQLALLEIPHTEIIEEDKKKYSNADKRKTALAEALEQDTEYQNKLTLLTKLRSDVDVMNIERDYKKNLLKVYLAFG